MANSARVKVVLACTECGDRINQIVFIGKNINREKVDKRLRECIYRGEKGETF